MLITHQLVHWCLADTRGFENVSLGSARSVGEGLNFSCVGTTFPTALLLQRGQSLIPQPLLLADQKHISSSRGKWMWRPGRAGSPHKLLTFLPLTPASECCGSCSPGIALDAGWWILQTISLKHGVDPCTDVNVWLCCVGSLRSKHLHVLVCVSRLNGE